MAERNIFAKISCLCGIVIEQWEKKQPKSEFVIFIG